MSKQCCLFMPSNDEGVYCEFLAAGQLAENRCRKYLAHVQNRWGSLPVEEKHNRLIFQSSIAMGRGGGGLT